MEKAAGVESPSRDPGQKTMRETMKETMQEAAGQIDDLRERLGDTSQRILAFIKERPGVCLLGAVAAGYIIGRLARSKD